ncbi:outer membrane protein assembly factor BamB [uncultured Gammaproteobacteria bacterium]
MTPASERGTFLCRRLARLGLGAILGPVVVVVTLAGCGVTDSVDTVTGWFGNASKPPLPGDRISVLRMERKVEPDPRLADLAVTLPAAVRNDSWPQAGGQPNHAMGHLALASDPHQVWKSDIGSGSSRTLRLIGQPVVADGRVFAMDAASQVTALEEQGGRRLWQADLVPENERGDAMSGAVAFADGRLFAATGYAEVLALDPGTGAILWRKRVPGPVRGAPTVVKGRVMVVTLDNQTVALSADDGQQVWSHTGILETAGLLGAVSPASDGNVVVVPYSSGELFALRLENGRPAWGENLAAIRRIGAITGLADIRGMPVIDRGMVLAVSHSGRTVAIDQRIGARMWEQELGGVDTPWLAGDFVFLLSNDNEVVALTRNGGRVRWVTPLGRFENEKKRKDSIQWRGPVLAGERLWLVGSTEELVGLAPETGDVVTRIRLPGPAMISPVVANGTLFVLMDNGTLVAFR